MDVRARFPEPAVRIRVTQCRKQTRPARFPVDTARSARGTGDSRKMPSVRSTIGLAGCCDLENLQMVTVIEWRSKLRDSWSYE